MTLHSRTHQRGNPPEVASSQGNARSVAFITVDAVRRLAGDLAADPDWNAGLDKMLAYAGSKGWMDPSGTAIQAHVEWAKPV